MSIPFKIKALIEAGDVIFSFKSRLEIEEGHYDYEVFENSVLRGIIKKKEKDEKKRGQYKYTIVGPALNGDMLYSCGKVVKGVEKSYFVITFHGAN